MHSVNSPTQTASLSTPINDARGITSEQYNSSIVRGVTVAEHTSPEAKGWQTTTGLLSGRLVTALGN